MTQDTADPRSSYQLRTRWEIHTQNPQWP